MTEIQKMRRYGAGLENDSRYWSKADRKTLLKAFDDGMGISEMALMLHRSETAIVQQLKVEKKYKNCTKQRGPYGRRFNKDQCRRCPYAPHNQKGAS